MDLYDLNEIPDHLKSYFEPAPQIGLEETPEQFIQKMVEVFHEVKRVTRDDGVLWLNFGDCYAGSGRGPTGKNGIQNAEERQGFINNEESRKSWERPCRTENTNAIIECVCLVCGETFQGKPGSRYCSNDCVNTLSNNERKGSRPDGWKPKDLMGIPWRCAFALQADGWYFRSAMPWIKRSCMPESTTDRPTSAIEYIFLMTKSAKYFYDGEAVRVPAAAPTVNNNREGFRGGNGRLYTHGNTFDNSYKVEKKSKKRDQTGNPTYTGFNERWKGKHSTTDDQAAGNRVLKNVKAAREESGSHDQPFGATRNYRNSDPFFESWQGLYSESENPLAFIINPQSRPELHFATFPDLLAETCIKAGTSEYGCCPKCGAPYRRIVECSGGTTGKSWHPHSDDGVTGQIGGMPTEGYSRQFKGWQPGCKCGEKERVPCLVLDPFMGSGTVAVVARDLNRSSVGCELNPDYVKIIKKRLQSDSCLDTGTVKYEFKKV